MHILSDKRIDALSGISLELGEGEAIGLTGPSGSGKSTLMKCIYRTYVPTSGSIRYSSMEYGPVDLATCSEQLILTLRRTEITYCSQFLSVIPRIPALEVVASRLAEKGVPMEEACDETRSILGRLNLPEELWDAYPSTFSGGEQQRINIARAIVARPRLLLVDEPTASLDPKTKDAVIDMVLELKDRGAAVVCITHDAYTLDGISDRVYRMESRDFVSSDAAVLPN
jgi:alpha-D-ribose 1-methylphosphonate 5-triphosphate synthase subunit PhnL